MVSLLFIKLLVTDVLNSLRHLYERFNIFLSKSDNPHEYFNCFENIINHHHTFFKLCKKYGNISVDFFCIQNDLLFKKINSNIISYNVFYGIIKNSEIGFNFKKLLHKLHNCKDIHECLTIDLMKLNNVEALAVEPSIRHEAFLSSSSLFC